MSGAAGHQTELDWACLPRVSGILAGRDHDGSVTAMLPCKQAQDQVGAFGGKEIPAKTGSIEATSPSANPEVVAQEIPPPIV
jgi:hypothetical protein